MSQSRLPSAQTTTLGTDMDGPEEGEEGETVFDATAITRPTDEPRQQLTYELYKSFWSLQVIVAD